MIDREAFFVLPLVHHLVKQRVYGLIPSFTPDVTTADHDLRVARRLAAPDVMTEAALHAAGHPNWNWCKLASESRGIQLRMMAPQASHERLVCRMCPLGRLARSRRRFRRLQVEGELDRDPAARNQASERAKQRCGPAANVLVARDQM